MPRSERSQVIGLGLAAFVAAASCAGNTALEPVTVKEGVTEDAMVSVPLWMLCDWSRRDRAQGGPLRYDTHPVYKLAQEYCRLEARPARGKGHRRPAGGTAAAGQVCFDHVAAAAREAQVPAALLWALFKVESNGYPGVVSRTGCVGCGQLCPAVCADFAVANPYDARENARVSALFLAQLIRRYGGDVIRAVAAYNTGPGNVRRAGPVREAFRNKRYTCDVLWLTGGELGRRAVRALGCSQVNSRYNPAHERTLYTRTNPHNAS